MNEQLLDKIEETLKGVSSFQEIKAILRLVDSANNRLEWRAKDNLKVGLKVFINHKDGYEGIITKVNRTRCKVSMRDRIWNVPISMIEPLESNV
jgi:hypothetical protein